MAVNEPEMSAMPPQAHSLILFPNLPSAGEIVLQCLVGPVVSQGTIRNLRESSFRKGPIKRRIQISTTGATFY